MLSHKGLWFLDQKSRGHHLYVVVLPEKGAGGSRLREAAPQFKQAIQGDQEVFFLHGAPKPDRQ